MGLPALAAGAGAAETTTGGGRTGRLASGASVTASGLRAKRLNPSPSDSSPSDPPPEWTGVGAEAGISTTAPHLHFAFLPAFDADHG